MTQMIVSRSSRRSRVQDWTHQQASSSQVEEDVDTLSNGAYDDSYDEEIQRNDVGSPSSESPAMWELMTNRGIVVDDTMQWLKLYTEGAGANAKILRSFCNMKNILFDKEAPVPRVSMNLV